MFEEPLFQNNILQTMAKYFYHYLTFDNWLIEYLAGIFFLYIIYKLITYKNLASYPHFTPSLKYSISWNTDKIGIFFALGCLSLYIINLYTQELSFFNNYDTMSYNTMLTFNQGVSPAWNQYAGRFSPIGFWEVNILYAISHNFQIINLFILIQTLIIISLIYHLLDFIPSTKRLIIIGLFIISPSFFWINTIIFPERMLIIYILCCFIYIKKYSQTQKSHQLWLSIFWLNLALYTKETTVLIFIGFLIYSFLYNLWNEKITLKTFLHPIKTIKEFPLEFLIFISIIIFAVLYALHCSAITQSPYAIERRGNLINTMMLYKYEIIILILSLIFYFKNHKTTLNNFLLNSMLVGSLCYATVIIFVLNLIPTSPHVEMKPYYMISACLCGLIYFIFQIKNKFILILSTTLCFFSFLITDFNIYQNEEGKYHRKVAEFFSTQSSEDLSIFLAPNSETSLWNISCWNAVYKYYFPHKKIFFSAAILQKDDMNTALFKYWTRKYPYIFNPIATQAKPISNDFYIIKKRTNYQKDLDFIKDIPHKLIYQNQLFEVYKIK